MAAAPGPVPEGRAKILLAAVAAEAAPPPAKTQAGPSPAKPASTPPAPKSEPAAAPEPAKAPSSPSAHPTAKPAAGAKRPAGSQPPAEKGANGAAPIVVTVGPNGLIIASEDLQALDEFERMLILLTGGAGGQPELTIFYLKHAKAAAVADTLSEIFSGAVGSSGSTGSSGSLAGQAAGAALGQLGGTILSVLGGVGSSAGSGGVYITADTRLNALVVQATPKDTDTIERLLKVLDQPDSPEEVLAEAKPRLIPVYNTQAEEVANVIRQVYQDRMVTGAAGGGGPGGRPGINPQMIQQFLQARFGGRGPGGRQRNEEPQKLSIGVDTRTNSIVVSAPEPLFQEVKDLVHELDEAAKGAPDTMEVVALNGASTLAVQQALSALVGQSVTVGGGGAQPASRGGFGGPGGPGSFGGQRGAFGGQPGSQFSPYRGGRGGFGSPGFGSQPTGPSGRGNRSFGRGGQ